MQFLSYLVNGISLGSIYAVIALGYTMVYGIARMLNFAHGDVIMVGGYVAFVMMTSLGLPALAAICAAVVVCTLLGVAIERVAYKPLREAPSLAVLITAIGMSYLLQNLALLIWGSAPKSFTSVVSIEPLRLFGGQLVVTGETLVTIVTSAVIMVALTLFVNKTKVGHAMQAVSEDKGAAQPVSYTHLDVYKRQRKAIADYGSIMKSKTNVSEIMKPVLQFWKIDRRYSCCLLYTSRCV